MISYVLSICLFLNIYSLPIPLEKAPNYDKKTEIVENDRDLKRINDRFFGQEPVTFKKLLPGEDLAESGKGSTIFFAYNNDGSPLAVIKQLPIYDYVDREELQDEISTLHERFFRGAKTFDVPKLIGTAEFRDEDHANAYIIETMAQGKSINSLVKDMATKSGSKRVTAYSVLNEAVSNTASSFAEFHKLRKFKNYSNYYDRQYSDVHTGSFDGPYGLIHGDAHLGNIFYNPKTHKTTFIDLSFMPKSLKGAPVGLDSGKFLFTLEGICSFYGLSETETQGLVNTYKSTYLAKNRKVTPEMLDEYTILAYKDFAFPSDPCLEDSTDQGAFLYRYAVNKVKSLDEQMA